METFGARFGQSMDCLSNLCDNLCIKLCFGVYEAGNGLGFWFHKVEPMLGEWATHGQPTARLVWGTLDIWCRDINLMSRPDGIWCRDIGWPFSVAT